MSVKANRCEHTLVGDRLEFKIVGDIDLYNAKSYCEQILAEVDKTSPASLTVNLTHTDFIDTAALAMLLMLYKTKVANGNLRLLVSEQSPPARSLKIGGFGNILDIQYT